MISREIQEAAERVVAAKREYDAASKAVQAANNNMNAAHQAYSNAVQALKKLGTEAKLKYGTIVVDENYALHTYAGGVTVVEIL